MEDLTTAQLIEAIKEAAATITAARADILAATDELERRGL